MENEEKATNKERREDLNVDERLTAFYGPPLPEQPLPAESWMRLQSQLSQRSFPAKRLMRRLLHRRYRRPFGHALPTLLEDTFEALVYDARLPYKQFPARIVSYALKSRRYTPAVRVSSIGRRKIKLKLPLQPLEPAELEVVLATGLARLLCMRKKSNTLRYLLLTGIEPVAFLILLVWWLHGLPLYILLIAIMILAFIGLGVGWSMLVFKRGIAMQADVLMVQWIGRSRACSGLHLLAGRTRTARRDGWSEPTLEERIAHVCGTRVSVERGDLTMVR